MRDKIAKLGKLLGCKRSEFLSLSEAERADFIRWLDDFAVLAERAEQRPVVSMKVAPCLEGHCPGKDKYEMYRIPLTVFRNAIATWSAGGEYIPVELDVLEWLDEGLIHQISFPVSTNGAPRINEERSELH
jgi:hypothetical protein